MSAPLAIGQRNTLTITKRVGFGVFLDGGSHGEILLPTPFIPPGSDVGDAVEVFVSLDDEDRLLATTRYPRAMAGEFAALKVVEVNDIGTFLDNGLSKDLLLPYGERKRELKAGQFAMVHVGLDKHSDRMVASMRLDRWLDKIPSEYVAGEEISGLVAARTELGMKIIINNTHWGLVHHDRIFTRLRIGNRLRLWVLKNDGDGNIDLTPQAPGPAGHQQLADRILASLEASGGVLPLGDKSAPEAVSEAFGASKANFKRALGHLKREGKVSLTPTETRLVK
ncbi:MULTISPECIES: CvfB family protein [Cobetia]|uniref:GntR family transcriptional regulator n=1 Tax=Cobetia crustatorum TaxID=553385 RepID=A0A558HNI4_9GAMM|nr:MULTISPECIES: S1-like domain-containing RNA-binding protein [Cobetia]TVU70695.1 GntR family transcriptional regulator [Cobetia crustatorum]